MSTIAFLGAGAMGEALMRGLLEARAFGADEIFAFDADASRLQSTRETLGVQTASDARALAGAAKVLCVALKPQIILAALRELGEIITPQHVVISIAAGVTTTQLESALPAGVPVVRVMPNTPALVGQAASAICRGAHADETHVEIAHRVFDAVGTTVDVEEKLLDAVTGLSGSGPAYVYVFIEALADAGVKMGLARDVAQNLAAQTVLGSAQMVLETGRHPGQLKDMVASPGGTTIAALHELERHAFRGAIMDAVEAATKRARELSG